MRSIPPNHFSSLSIAKSIKTMRHAKYIGESNEACYSRKLGCVIVDEQNFNVSCGRNGPPIGTPHTDSYGYIEHYLRPQLTEDEKRALNNFCNNKWGATLGQVGCKLCPRKILGYKSGERKELCSCVHAELNAIVTARRSVKDCFLFCYSPISCIECTKAIIQAGIKECHFLDSIYEEASITLYSFANIPIFLYKEEELN